MVANVSVGLASMSKPLVIEPHGREGVLVIVGDVAQRTTGKRYIVLYRIHFFDTPVGWEWRMYERKAGVGWQHMGTSNNKHSTHAEAFAEVIAIASG